jgi:hypothetical protein
MTTEDMSIVLSSLTRRMEIAIVSGNVVERLALISEGLSLLASIEEKKVKAQAKALAVIMGDRSKRGRL